jgi:hypothetical protein
MRPVESQSDTYIQKTLILHFLPHPQIPTDARGRDRRKERDDEGSQREVEVVRGFTRVF